MTGYQERRGMYAELERLRGRPLIAYVTSSRPNAGGQMGAEALPPLTDQLEALPADARELDFLIVSSGGDPTVAWRVVSLIRERVDRFSVLVPSAAFSAATLLALGADEIVMHRNGNLGPVDPQIVGEERGTDGTSKQTVFGAQDLAAFLQFVRDEVGLTDQAQLVRVFELFCQTVSPVGVGIAARGSQLSVAMSERLLKLHMKDGDGQSTARGIAEQLNSRYFHHGYPIGRREAAEIGLTIVTPPQEVERLLWDLWLAVEGDLEMRRPFNPFDVLRESPSAEALFGPVPQVDMPANLTPQMAQQLLQGLLAQVQVRQVEPAPFALTHAIVESARRADHQVSAGRIFATRTPTMQVNVSVVPETAGWTQVAESVTPSVQTEEA